MNRSLLRGSLLVFCTLLSAACAVPDAEPEAVTLRTDDERAIYAMGLAMGQSNQGLHLLDLTPREAAIMNQGLLDVALDRERQIELADYEKEFQPLLNRRREALAERERAASAPFLAAAEAEEGVVKMPSGTLLKLIEQGEGPVGAIPMSALVKLRVVGRTQNGEVFAETLPEGPPSVVRMTKLLPCWRDAFQEAAVGAKLQVTCPTDTAYGDQGMLPKVKPGAAVTFDLEIVDVIERELSSSEPAADPSDS